MAHLAVLDGLRQHVEPFGEVGAKLILEAVLVRSHGGGAMFSTDDGGPTMGVKITYSCEEATLVRVYNECINARSRMMTHSEDNIYLHMCRSS